MKIVVIGGTGVIGSRVVASLAGDGHEAVAAARQLGVDTVTGDGLAEALEGASAVVDASNSSSLEGSAATQFFTTSTRNLLAAEAAADIGHHLALSIVGVERGAASGYYRAKLVQEDLVRESSIPYTIIHATQLFEFARAIADAATVGDTVRLPHVFVRPIGLDDLAHQIGTLAQGPPANGIVEVAGPQLFFLDEFVRHGLVARGDSRPVVADPEALYFGGKLERRTLAPGADARLGETRFRDWAGAGR